MAYPEDLSRLFQIDVCKTVLAIGLFFRHVPLAFGAKIGYPEFATSVLTPYSFFLPVTGGFISILAFTLAYKKKIRTKKDIRTANRGRYLRHTLVLFLISLAGALYTFFTRQSGGLTEFITYFFTFGAGPFHKPGIIILLPISVLYGIFFLCYPASLRRHVIINILCLLLCLFFRRIFIMRYIAISCIFSCLGFFIIKTHIEYISRFYFLPVYLLLYGLFFYFPSHSDVSIGVETLMILVFSLMCFAAADAVKKLIYLKKFVIFSGRNLLYLYLTHILILNIAKKFIRIDTMPHMYTAIPVFMLITYSTVYITVKFLKFFTANSETAHL